MGKMVRVEGPGSVALIEEEDREVRPDEVRVRTLYSGVSAGTELSYYRGTNPYLAKKWDAERRLFVHAEPAQGVLPASGEYGLSPEAASGYPVDGLGYEEVGMVVDVGADVAGVRLGDVVWGTWGHREVTVSRGCDVKGKLLAPGVPKVVGVFSQIGAIALNVVLDADIHVGETVAVFGMGVLGQIVAQLARLNGAQVIAVDAIAPRLELACRLGASEAVDTGASVAERVKALTRNRGADVCLEVSGAYPALREAIRSVAYNGRVVAAGFFQGGGGALSLGEEFHHNRVQMVCSQISGVAPALARRWDEYRLQRTVMDLARDGRVELEPLISHVFPVADARQAFELLDTAPQSALQVVLSFEEAVG